MQDSILNQAPFYAAIERGALAKETAHFDARERWGLNMVPALEFSDGAHEIAGRNFQIASFTLRYDLELA